MAEARIVDMRRVPSVNTARLGKFDRLVTYTLGPGRTYLVVIPDETYSETAVQQAIAKDEQERGSIVGKTFTV